MNFHSIIIISNNFKSDQHHTICNNIYLKDSNTLIVSDEEYSFDYLIFDDYKLITNLKETKIMTDNLIPITNFFKQTSIENIFYSSNIGQIINLIINEEIE